LWKAWFLPLLRGEHDPCVPKKPPEVHRVDGEDNVPYSPQQIEDRTRKFKEHQERHKQTMKVPPNNITPLSQIGAYNIVQTPK
jgi:hypothetical protein